MISPSPRFVLVGLACAATTATILLMYRGDGSSGAVFPQQQFASVFPVAVTGVETPAEPVASDPPPKGSVRDFLKDYYGERWDSVKDGIEAFMGDKLDGALDEASIKPWDQVAEEIRSRLIPSQQVIESHAEEALNWKAEDYASWELIRAHFPGVPDNMRDVELREFHEIAETANASIRETAERRMTIVADLCTYKWAQSDFIRAPFCLPTSRVYQQPGRVAVAQQLVNSATGWVVCMPIYADELPPEYAALGKQVDKGLMDRTKLLANYLVSKK